MSVKLQKLYKGRLKPIEEKRRRGLHGLHLQSVRITPFSEAEDYELKYA